MLKKLLFAIFFLTVVSFTKAQLISIAQARLATTGATVTVRGVVLNGAEFGASTRYIYDHTGGLVIYGTIVGTLVRGDSVEATGTVAPYNNLFEVNPVTTLTTISTGNALPTPALLTIPAGFTEAYEANLVRFNNVTFSATGTFAGNTNYNISDGTNTAQVRINNASTLVGTPIPGGNVNVVGVMSQFAATYQLLPRDINDFPTTGTPPVFTTALMQSNVTTTGFTVSFNTLINGNTIIYYGLTPSLGQVASSGTMTTNHSVNLTGLTAATIYYVKGASVSATNDTSFSGIVPMATVSNSSGRITVYFDRSVDTTVAQGTNAIQLNNLCDDTLIAYMNRAQHTMDIAIYNMDNNLNVVTAINAAVLRGVSVRVVGDAGINATAWSLLNVGVGNKVLSPTGASFGIMHNKFMIIDANDANANLPVVWTGSMNWTDQQLTQDYNNIIIFQDQTLVRAYEIEFNEMFSGTFGPNKSDNTPHEFMIGGKRVESYFSPSDNTEQHLKNTIKTANHDLEFIVYTDTRFAISDTIQSRINAGVFAAGIIQDTASGSNAWNILAGAMPNTLFHYSGSILMHHKFAVVDANLPSSDPQVWTGSHNWSTAAQTKNDENSVVVHDATVANEYYQQFVARYHDLGGSVLPTYQGIDDNELKISASVYPDPSNGIFTLVFATDKGGESLFTITDLSGKIISSQKYMASSGYNAIHFDMHDNASGIYLLHIINGKESATQKFVLSK